ncbi:MULTISPECIES: hypothetical protein [Pseudomonas syringae group]|uniref:Lipoprotein n=2 Tax=Pseudomonas syringae group TaxID=136849 RepID=A0A3M4SUM1_PSEA0|nr:MULTISPECIES: hypothetical protein [Pseudomonas syringae group]POC85199.1 hypothetical protein BKM26_22260 [Pseudomonas avellanae]RMR18634.1 hypothetical protein ALP90_200253 [Pseudomonas amygdali pv. ulmi]
MKFKMTALSLAACCLMVGCDKANTEQAASAGSSGSSLLNSPKVSRASQSNAPVETQAQRPADASVPLSGYVDLNTFAGGQALTYLVLAKSPSGTTTDQKLGWLSPEYQATSDAFKKRDIEKAEWPVIKEQLSEYAKNDYYSLPIKAASVAEGMGLQNVVVGPYDFTSSSFPITSYGQYCWANPVRNNAGMNLQIKPSQFPCSIKVSDQNQAREIEQARAQGTLDLRGTLYLYIPSSSGMTAAGEVVHGVIELRDRQSSKVLTTVKL